MMQIAYHASHEQFSPSHLLRLAISAAEAGFAAIHSSDHFHPWSTQQGQSGYSFSWIAAALQATHLPFSMVCAPGQRYHPAIVAQALATLAEMYPGRIALELGSGEAINESITGQGWPDKTIRNERLLECATVIRRLLQGEEVSFTGHINVSHAQLYTLPALQPALFCAALSEPTAQWAGQWADGLLTTAGSIEDTQKKIAAFRQNGGQEKPVYLQFAFSYSRSEERAIAGAYEQWRSNLLPAAQLADLPTVAAFEEAAATITADDVKNAIPIYTTMQELLTAVYRFEACGANRVILHNVNRMQEEFIEDFGEEQKRRQ